MPEFFELRNIDKHFGDNHVVKNVSFGVRCGEIFFPSRPKRLRKDDNSENFWRI